MASGLTPAAVRALMSSRVNGCIWGIEVAVAFGGVDGVVAGGVDDGGWKAGIGICGLLDEAALGEVEKI